MTSGTSNTSVGVAGTVIEVLFLLIELGYIGITVTFSKPGLSWIY